MRAEHPELEDDACLGLGAEPPPTLRALSSLNRAARQQPPGGARGNAERLDRVHGDDAAAVDDPY